MRDVRYATGVRVCAGQSEFSAGGARDLGRHLSDRKALRHGGMGRARVITGLRWMAWEPADGAVVRD